MDDNSDKSRSEYASKFKKPRLKYSAYDEAVSLHCVDFKGISPRNVMNNYRNQSCVPSLPAHITYLKYTGYKGERVVQHCDLASRIVMVGSGSSKSELRKLCQVLDLVSKELSSPEITADHLMYCKSFLYIGSKKQVLGCVVAEPIDFAYKVTPSSNQDSTAVFCSREKVPALCGISRIWVHPAHRGRGIATQLLDSTCKQFIYGHSLERSSIAFSQPTGDGKNLAIHYTHTSEFLVYPEEAVKISPM